MSSLSQLLGAGSGPVTQIINAASAGGAIQTVSLTPCRTYASGALTANVLSTVLTVTGRGLLQVCGLRASTAASRTMRLQIVIDGVTIFDATSGTINNTTFGIWGAGYVSGDVPTYQPISFNSSLVIRVASSLTETNTLVTGAIFEVWQ